MQRLREPSPSHDALGEALHFMRVDGAFYSRSELTEPWGITVPTVPDHLWFHVVISGGGWLDLGGEEPWRLDCGDFALITQRAGHRLFSQPGVPTPDAKELERSRIGHRYEMLKHGGGGPQTIIVCGAVRFRHAAAQSLIAALPKALRMQASDSPHSEWMYSTLRLIAAEARELQPGGEAVITRLGDILVIQAIRRWIKTDSMATTGWLGAMKDPQVGRAMALIHRDPARNWTLGSLAREAAMSRSAFAARFTNLVGESAMRYVARWQMQVALDSLRDDNATVAEVAGRLNYQSEAAFSRAFKRIIGQSPGAIRRQNSTRATAT